MFVIQFAWNWNETRRTSFYPSQSVEFAIKARVAPTRLDDHDDNSPHHTVYTSLVCIPWKKRNKSFYLNIMKCFLTNRTKTWRVIHCRLSGQKSSLFFSYHFLSCYNVEEFLIQLPTAISKSKVCIRIRRPVRVGLFSGFRGMKRLGEFLLPPV